MNWSHALVAEHRHAALVAEAADRRLATASPEPAAREARQVSRRLLLPGRPAIAR